MPRLPYFLLLTGILSALLGYLLFISTNKTDLARPLLMLGAILTPVALTLLLIRYINRVSED